MAIQAGLYPNPPSATRGTRSTGPSTAGSQGAFVEQTVKTAKKLRVARTAAEVDVANAELALRRAVVDLRDGRPPRLLLRPGGPACARRGPGVLRADHRGLLHPGHPAAAGASGGVRAVARATCWRMQGPRRRCCRRRTATPPPGSNRAPPSASPACTRWPWPATSIAPCRTSTARKSSAGSWPTTRTS